MIATSPPYFGLRDYGTATWEGGDPECDHAMRPDGGPKQLTNAGASGHVHRNCKCGAIRKDAQLGMEKLHDCLAWARGDEPCGGCYVCNMRTWAREMWRVLRDDGVMFLNLGDSYAARIRQSGAEHAGELTRSNPGVLVDMKRDRPPGLKEKDLVGIPWRVALALQADGWYLRSDIIWAKPNPMPESVTDRATKSHEYIFMLAKSQRYYFDAEAIKEYGAEPDRQRNDRIGGANGHEVRHSPGAIMGASATRNARTVWTIATAPYSGAHYATWPPALVERMVKAGTPERGVCPECGRPWERITERGLTAHDGDTATTYANGSTANRLALLRQAARERGGEYANERKTVGWRPTCAHTDATPVPAIVLDPFAGSGTTLLVARQLGRIGLGFDLSEKYLYENARTRLGHDKLAAWGNGIKDTADHNDMPLFAGVTI
jgi:DNA modification methylase